MDNNFTFLSLSGGSGLSMKDLFDCSYKFYLKKLGYRPKMTSLGLIEGLIFHAAAEKRLKCEPIDLESIKSTLLSGVYHDDRRDTVLEFDNTAMSTKKQTKVEKSALKMEQMINKLHEVRNEAMFGSVVDLKPDDIERPFRCSELLDPLTGSLSDRAKRLRDEGLVFCGRADVLCNDIVHDLKTSGQVTRLTDEEKEEIAVTGYLTKKNPFDVNLSFQLGEYAYLATMEEGHMIDTVKYHIFSKHVKACEYIPMQGSRTVQDFKKVSDAMICAGEEYLRCEKESYEKTGQVRSDCRDAFMQLCPFHEHCHPNRYGKKKVDLDSMESLRRI